MLFDQPNEIDISKLKVNKGFFLQVICIQAKKKWEPFRNL